MGSFKLEAGSMFPSISVPKSGGGELKLGSARGNTDWQLVIVYRGKHCPICTNYLAELNELYSQFLNLGVDVIAVSADTEEKVKAHTAKMDLNFDIGYDLSINQMKDLGLYISSPRSPSESDRPFSEPGVFVINEKNQVQVIDISNGPFVRPTLSVLLSGLSWIRNPENNYPIRGTYQ